MKFRALTAGVTAAVLMTPSFAPCVGSAAATFTPHEPSLVAATSQPNQYVYFPQTLRWVGASLLISYQSDSDALHDDDGWTGGLVGSKDAGASWVAVEQPLSNRLVKSCVSDDPSSSSSSSSANSTFCLEYATRKIGPNSTVNTQATLGAHVYAVPPAGAGSDAPFVQVSVRHSTLNFPASHAPKSWGPNTFLMVADGKIHALKSGGLLLLLYGNYDTDSAYSIVAVKSVDDGASWNWVSTVSHGAPAPCDKPSEHDCTYLADGSLYCVWRSDGGTLCSSRSVDEGESWSPAQPLSANSPAPTPAPPITRECQSTLDNFCSNSSAQANGDCIAKTVSTYPDALPMYGLYDAGCGKSELSGPCDGPTTAPRQWRCYSHLAVVSDSKSNYSHSWSNDTKHPNAYCSESGPALAKLYSECAGVSPTPSPSVPGFPSGVEPKLERLSNGLLVVSSGRPGIYLWAAKDLTTVQDGGSTDQLLAGGPVVSNWSGINLADAHNQLYPDEAFHFSTTVPSTKETTSYTGMVPTKNGGVGVIVSYDRLANGWDPAPYPPGSNGRSALFAMRVDITI